MHFAKFDISAPAMDRWRRLSVHARLIECELYAQAGHNSGRASIHYKALGALAGVSTVKAKAAVAELYDADRIDFESIDGAEYIVVKALASGLQNRISRQKPSKNPAKTEAVSTGKPNEIKPKTPVEEEIEIESPLSSIEDRAPRGWGPPAGNARVRAEWERAEIARLGSDEFYRLLGSREENRTAEARAADERRRVEAVRASEPPPPSKSLTTAWQEKIFAEGVPCLTRAGMPDAKARTLLGQLIKAKGHEATLDSVRYAASSGVVDPKTYLYKQVHNRNPPKKKSGSSGPEQMALQ